jgi:N-sulfoglucosamine sulfohydrolase
MRRCDQAFVWVLIASTSLCGPLSAQSSETRPRPNILWITCEDVSRNFGCYGDESVKTPNIDAFAATGVVYHKAFAHAAMPTTNRSGIVTGEYPTSTGAHHTPTRTLAPKHLRCFTELLRATGYHCTNRHAAHYGLGPMEFRKELPRSSWSPYAAWDFSGNKQATWRSRQQPGQPFFAIMGHRSTASADTQNHSQVAVPPYLPNTPGIRKAVATNYAHIEAFDAHVGRVLAQLKQDGLADNTIVWIYSTSGRDLFREKRWLYNAGTGIPFILRVPSKYQTLVFGDTSKQSPPGSSSNELVSTIDFARTTLSLAHESAPTWMRGRAFLGRERAKAPRYVFAARDRIDEANDCLRSVRDGRFLYIRNHMPEALYSQPCASQDATAGMQELRRLQANDKLPSKVARFFSHKNLEELYDTDSDPYQLHNLVKDPVYRGSLTAMREAQIEWSLATHDIGLIPEAQFNRFKIQKFGVIQCSMPMFRLATDDRGQTAVQIACPTANSAVIYQINDRGAAGPIHWNLYTEPVTLGQGQTVSAYGVGIGNTRSMIARFRIGDPQATEAKMELEYRAPHWTQNLGRSTTLKDLQDLKRVDFMGTSGFASFQKACSSKSSDLRYWALRAIRRLAKTPSQLEAVNKEYARALKSSSDAIKRTGVPFLIGSKQHRPAALAAVNSMLLSPSEHVAFAGLQALADVGKQATPLRPSVEKMLARFDQVQQNLGYLPPPLATSWVLANRILESTK